jgi:hypothetical protein
MTEGRPVPLDALETPALVVDIERLERNLERWQRYCNQTGLANRPHVKTHKSVEIARRHSSSGRLTRPPSSRPGSSGWQNRSRRVEATQESAD